MIRVEGKIRGYAKERIRCDFCGVEQTSIYPYDSYAEGLECSHCGMVIALYSLWIHKSGEVRDATTCIKRW